MGESLRNLLVDDHVLFQKGIASLLKGCKNMVVVGEAGDGCEAVLRSMRFGAEWLRRNVGELDLGAGL